MRKPSRLTDIFSLASPDMADSVGARIRLLRQRRGLTQEALALRLGVSRSAIALWETDRGGEVGHLAGLSEALGVPVDFFLNGMVRNGVTATLTTDENALLELYRSCPASERLALLRTAGRLLRQAERRASPPGPEPAATPER